MWKWQNYDVGMFFFRLLVATKDLKLRSKLTFQKGNDSRYTARVTMERFRSRYFHVLEWVSLDETETKMWEFEKACKEWAEIQSQNVRANYIFITLWIREVEYICMAHVSHLICKKKKLQLCILSFHFTLMHCTILHFYIPENKTAEHFWFVM